MSESDVVAQLRAQLAERDAELRAERQRREAAEAGRETLQELTNGTFCSQLNEVWDVRSEAFTPAHFYALLRRRCPIVHRETFDAAKVVTNVADRA
jgi:5-formyltetrahydrofolate cyclo-ligase